MRQYQYDYMRALAVIFIITIHVSDYISAETIGDLTWWFRTTIQVITRVGLPVFFMLSGALMLNSKSEEGLLTFYRKRIVKIVIPLFIYSLVYLFFFNYKFNLFIPNNFLTAINEIISGPVFPHLWFVYSILGIYLFTPFLKVMVQNLSDKLFLNLMVIILIIMTYMTYSSIIGIEIGIKELIFNSWILYYLLGAFLTRQNVLKYYKIFLYLGGGSFFITLIILRYFPILNNYIFDFSPTMIFMASTFFVLFQINRNRFNKHSIIYKLVNKVNINSYSIYLIHMLVIDVLNNKFHINANTFNPFFGTLITVIFTIIISYVIVFILDKLLLGNIVKLYSSIKSNFLNKSLNKASLSNTIAD